MDSNTIQRLMELLSDKVIDRIWRELNQYRYGVDDDDDARDARHLRLEVEAAIDALYGMTAEDFIEYMAELNKSP